MSRYIIKAMYLEKAARLTIYCDSTKKTAYNMYLEKTEQLIIWNG